MAALACADIWGGTSFYTDLYTAIVGESPPDDLVSPAAHNGRLGLSLIPLGMGVQMVWSGRKARKAGAAR